MAAYEKSGHPHMAAWKARLEDFAKGEVIRAKLEELAELGYSPKELTAIAPGDINIEPPAGAMATTGSEA